MAVFTDGGLTVETSVSSGVLTAFNNTNSDVGVGIGNADGISAGEYIKLNFDGTNVFGAELTLDGLGIDFTENDSSSTQVVIKAFGSGDNLLATTEANIDGDFAETLSVSSASAIDYIIVTTDANGDSNSANFVLQSIELSTEIDDTIAFQHTDGDGNTTSNSETYALNDNSSIINTTGDMPSFNASTSVTRFDLDIDAALTDVDGSEVIQSYTVAGLPTGATLSAGTNNGDGSYTLLPTEIADLQYVPAVGEVTDNVQLTITVSTTDVDPDSGTVTANSASTTVTLDSAIDGIALGSDGNNALDSSVTTNEDVSVNLGLETIVPLDSNDTIANVTISGVPEGASLNLGVNNGDGTYTLAASQLANVVYTPAANDSSNVVLGVNATLTAEGQSQTFTGNVNITVNAVADDTDLALDIASATPTVEGETLILDLSATLQDVDGSESFTSFTLSGMPADSSFNVGSSNGDGTWTIAATEVPLLTMELVDYDSNDFILQVTAESRDVDPETGVVTTNTHSENFTISVDAKADNISLSATLSNSDFTTSVDSTDPTSGGDTTPFGFNEDAVIDIDTTAVLLDTDGTESITSYTVAGVPTNAVLSAGVNNGDGSWSLSANDLTDLTLTTTENSGDDFTLTITAHNQDVDPDTSVVSTGSTSVDIEVVVNAVPDDVSITVDTIDGSVNEDLPLDIAVALNDLDGSETIVDIIIGNIPTGATLSAGTDNGDGTYTLTEAQLAGLTLNATVEENFVLDITVNSEDHDPDTGELVSHVTSTTQAINLIPATVEGPADATVISSDVSGDEDTAIDLGLTELVALDANETISDVLFSGVPTGAVLSAGTDNGDGTWSVPAADIAGLTITPPEDDSNDFTMTTAVTFSEGNTEQTYNGTVNVVVDAVVDSVTGDATLSNGVVTSPDAFDEDQLLTLDFNSILEDADGSETILSYTVSGFPSGVVFSPTGTDNGDGSVTFTAMEAVNLTLALAEHDGSDFDLNVVTTIQETDPDTGDVTTVDVVATLPVVVNAVPDDVTLTAADVSGTNIEPIDLDITTALVDADGSESITDILISGIPIGVTLSAGTDNGDGSYTLTPAELTGLTLSTTSDDDFPLTVVVNSTDTDADTGAVTSHTTETNFNVTVTQGVIDGPADLSALSASASGNEDEAINLNLANIVSADANEQVSDVTISGLPSGATLSAGVDNGDGSYTVAMSDLAGLTVTPPENSGSDFDLTTSVTYTEGSLSETFTGTVNVVVEALADPADLTTTLISSQSSVTVESNPDELPGDYEFIVYDDSIVPSTANSVGFVDGSESFTLGNVAFTTMSVTDNDAILHDSVDAGNGQQQDSDGQQTLASPINFTDFAGVVGDTVNAINKTIVTNSTTGESGAVYTLEVGTGEYVYASTIVLNSGDDITWTNSNTDASVQFPFFDIGQVNYSSLSTQEPIDKFNEDDTILVNLSAILNDVDGSENLNSYILSNFPSGTTFSAGTDNNDGTWTVTAAESTGLTMTLAQHDDTDFTLGVSIQNNDFDPDSLNVTSNNNSVDVTVIVTAQNDGVDIATTDTTGDVGVAIPLDINASLIDTDGSEAITSVVISNIPLDATLSAGVNNGDGSYTLDASDLGGLTITPNDDSTFTLNIAVNSSETDSETGVVTTTVSTDTLTVTMTETVEGPVDNGVLTSSVTGDEDTAIDLGLGELVPLDGSETVSDLTIGNVPTGSILSAGNDNGDGTWTVPVADMVGLTITPPANSSEDFNLTTSVSFTEGGVTQEYTGGVSVAVTPVIDGVDLTPTASDGVNTTPTGVDEDGNITLDLAASFIDDDGSETITGFTIEGLPAGVVPNVGTDLGNGSYSISVTQAANLALTLVEHDDTDFDISVTAGVIDTDPDTNAVVQTDSTVVLSIPVTAIADDAAIIAPNVTANRDEAADLVISTGLVDTDGSESITSIVIGNVP